MRRLVWCHHLLADIRIGDIAGYDRFATSVIELPQFQSFGPFPKSARVTVYRDSHDYRPFAGIWTHINGDEMKTCEVRMCCQRGPQHDPISSEALQRCERQTIDKMKWE